MSLAKKLAFAAVLSLLSAAVQAMPVFVGSYHVTDGINWPDNPPVYSAIEAAELVFGAPVGGFYSISINGSDPNLISNTGWYAVIGIGPDIFAEDFSQDGGPTVGYNGAGWTSGDDISAYVNDAFFGANEGTNYVFFTRDVPEPATLALVGLGLVAAGRKRLARK